MLKLFFQNYHVKRILIILVLILSIFLFKIVIDYLNYKLAKDNPVIFPGYDLNCLEYVTRKNPSFKEYQESEYKNLYTYILLDNKDIYIACFKDIMYYDYPSFWQLNSQEIKKYSLNEAFQNKLLMPEKFAKISKDNFEINRETHNYEITDFYLYDE